MPLRNSSKFLGLASKLPPFFDVGAVLDVAHDSKPVLFVVQHVVILVVLSVVQLLSVLCFNYCACVYIRSVGPSRLELELGGGITKILFSITPR
jgi:hypothetical protein